MLMMVCTQQSCIVMTMQSKIRMKKFIMSMLLLRAGDVEPGMNVYAEGSSRAAGRVVALDGTLGIALIRLEAAFGPKESPLHVGTQDGSLIKAHRPSWWPQDWGQE